MLDSNVDNIEQCRLQNIVKSCNKTVDVLTIKTTDCRSVVSISSTLCNMKYNVEYQFLPKMPPLDFKNFVFHILMGITLCLFPYPVRI